MADPVATVQSNIQAVVRLEEQQQESRTFPARVGDAIGSFAGTITFVLLHLLVFVLWTAFNVGMLPGWAPFDPFPFSLLGLIVSMEGVLLSTFVLIKQNLMSQLSDRRNHLDLQVNLLAEQEISKLIKMVAALSLHLKVPGGADAEADAMSQETAVQDLAEELDRSAPEAA